MVVDQVELGTHYKLKANSFDLEDQFMFISDLTEQRKVALATWERRSFTGAYYGPA